MDNDFWLTLGKYKKLVRRQVWYRGILEESYPKCYTQSTSPSWSMDIVASCNDVHRTMGWRVDCTRDKSTPIHVVRKVNGSKLWENVPSQYQHILYTKYGCFVLWSLFLFSLTECLMLFWRFGTFVFHVCN
jgi:hypothetical protein